MGAGRKIKGKWQVERERCYIGETRPRPPFRNAVPVAGVVSGILKKLGLENVHISQLIEERWEGLVGAAVAAHTRPGEMKDGELTIFVDSSVWLNELSRYGRKKILDNFRTELGAGKIKKIGFKLDPDLRPARKQ